MVKVFAKLQIILCYVKINLEKKILFLFSYLSFVHLLIKIYANLLLNL